MTDEELKQWAIDLVDGKIYTDAGVSAEEIPLVFMPFALMDRSELLSLQKKFETGEYHRTYAYMDQAMPRAINGKPCFMSCKFLSRDEAKRAQVMVEKLRAAKAQAIATL